MTQLAIGSSRTIQVGDNGIVTITSNGGFGSYSGSVSGAFGPGPFRQTLGPLKEGATITVANDSCAALDVDAQPVDLLSVSGAWMSPSAKTYGGVMDAITTLLTKYNGGIVRLGPELYDISSAGQALPIVSGIYYQGAGYITDTGNSLNGGTIIQAASGFNAFEVAATDLGALPANVTAMRVGMALGCGVRDLGVLGGSYGLKLGAKYRAGVYNSDFQRVYLQGQTQWGVWAENCQYSNFHDIKTQPIDASVGHQWYGGSTGTLFNHGNLKLSMLFGEGGGLTTRGFVFQARGANSAFNDIQVFKLQSNINIGGATATQAAAMANGSANITVTDGSKFPLDMPVTVSAGANGFNQWQTYFVVSRVGNVIQLSDFMGGTAKTATGNTAVNLITYGFPALEIVGYGNTSNNIIQPSQFYGIDVEGSSTTQVVRQNDASLLALGTNNFSQGGGLASTVTGRNSSGQISSLNPVILDFDGNSAAFVQSLGINKMVGATQPQGNNIQGLVRDTSGNVGVNLGSGGPANIVGMQGVNSPGMPHVYPFKGLSQKISTSTATSLTLDGNNIGATAYVGTGAAAWTLPTLSGSAGGDPNTYLGAVFEVSNCSTSAVNLTLATAAGQPFGRQSGKTSVTIAPGQSLSVRAQTRAGAEWFWQVVGNNGVTI